MKRKQDRRRGHFTWLVVLVVMALAVGVTGIAKAAEFGGGDNYQLPAGQTVGDDLYVTGGTITIDGDVEGDLVAFGGTIEVNGNVSGDVIAAGGSIVINGKVSDDVRAAGAGIRINGSVGDDLMLAGGGMAPGGFTYPMIIQGRSVEQGIFVAKEATIGGDAYIVGGTGEIAGTIDHDLFATMNRVTLTGSVGGNAQLRGNTINVADSAKVAGELTYETGTANVVPPDVAAQVTPIATAATVPQEEPLANRFISWTINLARGLIGLLALGAILLYLFPGFTNGAAGEMRRQPWLALVIGLLVVIVAVPVTLILVALAWLFWGAFVGGLAATLFMFGLWGVLWFVSPALAGFCLGQTLLRNTNSKLLQLFIGSVIILLLARAAEWIPVVGGLLSWLVLLVTFMFAVGAIILVYRQHRSEQAPTYVQPIGSPAV